MSQDTHYRTKPTQNKNPIIHLRVIRKIKRGNICGPLNTVTGTFWCSMKVNCWFIFCLITKLLESNQFLCYIIHFLKIKIYSMVWHLTTLARNDWHLTCAKYCAYCWIGSRWSVYVSTWLGCRTQIAKH